LAKESKGSGVSTGNNKYSTNKINTIISKTDVLTVMYFSIIL